MKYIITPYRHNEIYSKDCGVLVSGKASDEINYLLDKVKKLEVENAKLRECVEFYADSNTYEHFKVDYPGKNWHRSIIPDDDCCHVYNDEWCVYGGKRARQVLKELEDKNGK